MVGCRPRRDRPSPKPRNTPWWPEYTIWVALSRTALTSWSY